MYGISGYEPDFYDNRNLFIENNKDLLRFLVGQIFEKVYWVWDKKGNDWFRDCPVAVQLSNGLCTLCANRDSDFSVGWNNIDFKQHIDWYGMYEFDLEWRVYENDQIIKLVGKSIQSVEVINYLHTQKVLYSKDDASSVDKMYKLDLLHGVGFSFEDYIFAVTNGLDDNRIEILQHGLGYDLSNVTIQ